MAFFKFNDTNEAETVYIPETERGSVCISTQVGCTLTCRFCHTGTQPLVRNLSASEVVGQFLAARDAYGEWPNSQQIAAPFVKHRSYGNGGASIQLRQYGDGS